MNSNGSDLSAASSSGSALETFHPIIARWFLEQVGSPSEPQRRGWPSIGGGRNVLIAAPTGSGKTLAAFLSCLGRLFQRGLEGKLEDRVYVLYVSPLKALGNDIQRNLLAPLEEIYRRAVDGGLNPQPIRVLVRSGDTPASERAKMIRKPPHILITTPESLYLYLTAERSRETLRRVETVIVDEIHALARDKRGSHFALSLERLKHLLSSRPQLVGLSATQKPLSSIAEFLTGTDPGPENLEIIQVGHVRPWTLSLEVPDDELSAVATHEMWGQIYDRIQALAETHRTTLIFSNTRRLSERVAHDLGERLGHDRVAAHHGSMARELRLSAETRLKSGQLRAMVATASLELGIDIGAVDLVCQLGTPKSISVFLQRVGRAGHRLGGVSKGILFAMTRDELVECTALIRAVREGELDAIRIPQKPLDILAQQIVAACAEQDWSEDQLFQLVRRASPYRDLSRAEFDQVIEMLSEGVATAKGRSRTHLHRDRVNGKVRARKGARLTALMNGGAIPDTFIYPVIAEPEGKMVGTLDEDFAVESMAGDVFLLGSTAWRIRRVAGGAVHVEDAKGQAPTVPFWLGEAPARTDELSRQVSRLRQDVLSHPDPMAWLESELSISSSAADNLCRYLRSAAAILGGMPSQTLVVAERFFDEAGGMQLIIHAPFGSRINRAWGLALRKSFCRAFDFELQAAATEDGIILSLGEKHSFPLADIFDFLSPSNVEDVLTQAVLQSPLFGTRFRWNATRALALLRMRNGQRIPPQIQRARTDDLMAALFPSLVACQDNHPINQPIELSNHPIIVETIQNCLREALDVDGLKEILTGIRGGRIKTAAVDLPEPSPLAHALLNSQPYTYLDDAPLEERRARAVSVRRTLPPEDASAFGALDQAAIDQVVADAQPVIRDEEELHDALLQLILLGEHGISVEWAEVLAAAGRACRLTVLSGAQPRSYWVARERLAYAQALFPGVSPSPDLPLLPGDRAIERDQAVLAWVRGTVEICGPKTSEEIAADLDLLDSEVNQALLKLESEGQVLRGHFRPRSGGDTAKVEWCDRRLLQRIHRLTIGRLRAEIQPLTAQDFMRFLLRWQHVDQPELRGRGGLLKSISLLQGYEAPASAWEHVLIPSRMKQYLPELLERACWDGEVAWGRLTLRESKPANIGPRRGLLDHSAAAMNALPASPRSALPTRNANITLMRREELDWLLSAARPGAVLADGGARLTPDLSPVARQVAEALERRGACFFLDLVSTCHRLPAEVEDGLWELLASGLVTADAIENLRVLQSMKRRKRQRVLQRGGPGRWTLLRPHDNRPEAELLEKTAKLILQRYGIVFRDLALRESLSPPWRDLLRVFRRLEARGEIRGGRFIHGFVGEQYALPEAVEMARAVRRLPKTGKVIHLAAVDPLNLTGVVFPGERIPAMVGNYVTYVDGVPQLSETTDLAPSVATAPN